jgi:hypothetical protein
MRPKLKDDDFASCPQFNHWIDESYEDDHDQLEILTFKPRPSEVLFQMSRSTYRTAFSDFQTAFDDDLKRTVMAAFPLPIAYYFYRFENGFESELQRLHLLRDVWEAIIDILHALVVGEARFRHLNLAEPVKFSHLLSDRVSDRLYNIERIIGNASAANLNLSVGKLASQTLLEKMRELNQSRNAFSHGAAQSEAQARTWIGECYEDVLDVLDDIRALDACKLLRYIGQIDGNTLRCEIFNGHSFTRTIQAISLTPEQVRNSQQYFQLGQMLVLHEDILFSLRPFIYYREDNAGHMTKPCIFRKTRGEGEHRMIEFAVVGDAIAIEEKRSTFQQEMNELRALFGLGTD